MKLTELKDKKIGILGYGLEGRAVADYLALKGVDFCIFDKGQKLESEHKDIKFFLGEDYLEKANQMDILFRSPGIKLSEPALVEYIKSGKVLTSQIKYFFDNCRAKIIGVTGTKGKGTTSKLIYEILKASGKKVFLAGNIGIGVLGILDQADQSSFVVLELSSFQLQDLDKSPNIAVVLMITSEHLDYHVDVEEYVSAKEAITKFQTDKDSAVINYDFPSSVRIGKLGHAKKLYVQTQEQIQIRDGIYAQHDNGIYFVEHAKKTKLGDTADLQLRGYHNVQNIGAALGVASALKLDIHTAWKVAEKFTGLEHRLEFVREVNKIKYYNDSFGTTPETTVAAVKSFSEDTVAIIGGFNKGGDYKWLAQELTKLPNLKAVVVIGVIAQQISKHLVECNFTGTIAAGGTTMPEIVAAAQKLANAGDVIVLAPATSSFGLFKDYKDRGNKFKEEVLRII